MHLFSKIIQEIFGNGNGSTIALKLDTAKAYDMMEWIFVAEVMRKLGYDD